MTRRFISESIVPLAASFDAIGMAAGEPGVPRSFRWRQDEIHVAGVLERWRECGDCTHGSGERYVRKHGFRVSTDAGLVMKLYFQRTSGKSRSPRARWWLHSIEGAD